MTQALVALDTNVLIRFLLNDDAAQAARARRLVAAQPVFLSPTVLLEAEWVLRSGYGCTAVEIASYLRAFLGLPQVQVADAEAVSEAMSSYEAGLDFADALHLALSGSARELATFDRVFIKKANRLQGRKLRLP